MSRGTLGARNFDPSWPLRPVVPTPHRDRLEMTLVASGSATMLFVGKPNGECVGVLEGDGLDDLVVAIATRRRFRDPSNTPGLALAPEGRRKQTAKRKGPA